MLIVRVTAQATPYADAAIADCKVQVTPLSIQLYGTGRLAAVRSAG